MSPRRSPGPVAPTGGHDEARTLSSADACQRLGIRPASLYAYVSRGLLRSLPGADGRSRRYPQVDVEALATRSGTATRAARSAIAWGEPVLDSELTLIDGGRFYYRGEDAVALSRSASFEEVCCLLWLGEKSAARALFAHRVAPLPESWQPVLAAFSGGHPGDRLSAALRLAAHADLDAGELDRQRVAACGARLVGTLACCAAGKVQGGSGGIAAVLRRGWAPRRARAERVLSSALVLCADHELNVSSFTARCVASAGATPYEAVDAGLAAVRGWRHGGMSDRVAALLAELEAIDERPSRRRARAVLLARRQAGELIPGFGHRLYPDGDPRWPALCGLMTEEWGATRTLEWAHLLATEGQDLLGLRPNVDLALATLAAELSLGYGGAWRIFALGRTAGWLAHAIEEYDRGVLIRPRARYVGVPVARSG